MATTGSASQAVSTTGSHLQEVASNSGDNQVHCASDLKRLKDELENKKVQIKVGAGVSVIEAFSHMGSGL
jgi:hypothetical protein